MSPDPNSKPASSPADLTKLEVRIARLRAETADIAAVTRQVIDHSREVLGRLRSEGPAEGGAADGRGR